MIEKFRSYEGRFLERLTRIQDPPPHPLQYRDRESRKMVKISVSLWSEEELREKFESLPKKGAWDKECETCRYPEFLHKTHCQRTAKVGEAEFSELWKAWSEFREKMDPIRKQYEDEIEKSKEKYEEVLEKYKKDKEEMDKRQSSSDILIGMKQMTDAITKGNEKMYEMFKGRPNKLVKPAKVPSWSKDMKLDAHLKALEVLMEMNVM